MKKMAISFFPNDQLLTVDKELINKKLLFHSHDPDEIVSYVLSNMKKISEINYAQKRKIKNELIYRLKEIIEIN